MSLTPSDLRPDELRSIAVQLRSIAVQLRSAVACGSLEQRARYRELRAELDVLEQEFEAPAAAPDLQQRALRLLEVFRRFQRHIEPGNYATL